MNKSDFNTITRSLTFLTTTQTKSGDFIVFSSLHPHDFKNSQSVNAFFLSSLILQSLSSVQKLTPLSSKASRNLTALQKKIAKFIWSQASELYSWNYWLRDSKESQTMPYPDDLDDTFAALTGLYLYQPEKISGDILAKVVKLLTSLEVKEGGPYRTWVVPANADQTWLDVDLTVNINIAYFLALLDIDLPNLNQIIEKAVSNNNFQSRYYDNPLVTVFFMSRFFQKKWAIISNKSNKEKIDKHELEKQLVYRQKLTNFILKLQKKDCHWIYSLDTALAISSLLRLGHPPQELSPSIKWLKKQQLKNGSWPATAIFPDPVIKTKIYYAGSEALTTACCLEALSLYQDKVLLPKVNSSQSIKSKKNVESGSTIYKQVVKNSRNVFNNLDQDIKQRFFSILEKVLAADQDKKITLLPYFFTTCLAKKEQNKIKSNFLVKLGVANLLAWVAYTIYDDLLDDEGDVKDLAVANICSREFSSIFMSILLDTDFNQIFKQIMNQLDAINLWELINCRVSASKQKNDNKNPVYLIKESDLPDFTDLTPLAKRSLGLALAPIAILMSLGYDQASSKVKNLLSFFTHYLIARQLDDDAHDWQQDLEKGHINSAGSILLRKYLKSQTKKKIMINKKNLTQLNQFFWYEIMPQISQLIIEQVAKAEKLLEKNPAIVNSDLLLTMVKKHERSAIMAIEEREKVLAFLKSYE